MVTGRESNDGELADVLAELVAREQIFLWPEFGTSRADLERMIALEFWEVGASGRRYSREDVLDELERRSANPQADVWETSEFRCQRLADEVYLLTYTLLQDKVRLTRRSTIWRRSANGWEILFHQGTLAEEG